jgi:glycosyltransferase involved in cell wall biosynthesis
MPSNPALTIVLPLYNPVEGWLKNVNEQCAPLLKEIPGTQMILVNDGSIDFTSSKENCLQMSPEVKFISYCVNRGKGYALREGIKQAEGDLIIYTDIDFPYTTDSFLKLFSTLKDANTDIAIGIRSEEYYTHLPKERVRISKLLKWFIKTFLRIPIADTQCGLKGMNQKGKEVFLQTTIDRYLFDLEFVFLAARNKLNIKSVEVELRPEIQLSKMNWRILLQEFGNFLKIFVRSIK